MRARPAMPPIVPPTMAPVLLEDEDEGEEEDVWDGEELSEEPGLAEGRSVVAGDDVGVVEPEFD